MQYLAKNLPLRLRVLLALIAAAGAGVYLTYSAAVNALVPFAEGEAGARLMARLEPAAAITEAGISAAAARAKRMAAYLTSGEDIASAAGKAAGAAAPELVGAWVTGPSGGITGALKNSSAPAASPSANLKKTAAVGPPGGGSSLEYDVFVPAAAGTLRCRFRAAALPRALSTAGGGIPLTFRFAKREGNRLRTFGPAGSAEIEVKSPGAEVFQPALEGNSGSGVTDGPRRTLYAYTRLAGPDWIMTAETDYAPAASAGLDMLRAIRLAAMLAFAMLAITAFFAAGAVIKPLNRSARAAAALLEDCGVQPGEQDTQPAAELIEMALAEASRRLRETAARDASLEQEAEKLRGEEADLKSQNLELEKLNKYLSERETRISELKRELAELKERSGGGL